MKRKYERMYGHEAVGAFALCTVLMALFTNPVMDAVKTLVRKHPSTASREPFLR
jgi:hypothetical protein